MVHDNSGAFWMLAVVSLKLCKPENSAWMVFDTSKKEALHVNR